MELEIGAKSSIEFKVEDKDLAKNLQISPEDNFPEVFATARMVALMECSAAKILIPFLEEGQLSVGVEVNIKHLAPTLSGDTAISTATFEGMEGKLYIFVGDDDYLVNFSFWENRNQGFKRIEILPAKVVSLAI